jgi:hypothetical protein
LINYGLLRRVFEAAREAGDLVYPGYALRTLLTNLIASGRPFAETESEADRALEFARKARFGLAFDIVSLQLALIRTLRGQSTFGSFNDSEFDERSPSGGDRLVGLNRLRCNSPYGCP